MMQRKRKKSSLSNQIEESANKPIERSHPIDTSVLIPSGNTLLNCACSDNPLGAFALGRIVTLPGGSASGKTMLMLTMLAEMTQTSRFDDYEMIYDDAEATYDSFDIPYLFGNALAQRLVPPQLHDNVPLHSETIQDFKMNILTRVKTGIPFVYILDSLDSLSTDEEIQKEYQQALIKAKNPESIKSLKGSYKVEKAKAMSEILRIINGQMKHTKSALFLVQQERANIGVTFGPKKTTSGGAAPFFYSSHQIWLNKIKSLSKEVKKQKRTIGHTIVAHVKKNKITGKLRDVQFDIYYSYGIDDLSSCVNFLVSTDHWKKTGLKIIAHEFGLTASQKEIVQLIENKNLQVELKTIVGQIWNEIEDSMSLNRQKKFQ